MGDSEKAEVVAAIVDDIKFVSSCLKKVEPNSGVVYVTLDRLLRDLKSEYKRWAHQDYEEA